MDESKSTSDEKLNEKSDADIELEFELEELPALQLDCNTVIASFSRAPSENELRIHEKLKEEPEQSEYEEVAANVSNTDDPTTLVLTFRSLFLGVAFTCVLSFINQFFAYRTSPLIVGVLVAQLLSFLIGKVFAKLLPKREWNIFRWKFSFNPGPFTMKEHCIITTMAGAANVSTHF